MILLTRTTAPLRRHPTKRWFLAGGTTFLLPAAVAGFHELLTRPRDWTPPLQLGADLQRRGIDQVFFLRHGNTGKADQDFERSLTETGRAQCRSAGATYGRRHLRPLYPKALVSPAPRTMETAQLFVKAMYNHHHHNEHDDDEGDDDDDDNECASTIQVQFVPVPALYDGTMQPAGSQLFAKLGYAPLRVYLEAANPTDRQAAQTVLGAYAAAAVDALEQQVGMETHDDSATVSTAPSILLVVAHAIYLPAAVLGVASLVGQSLTTDQNLDVVLSTNTKEAEGYLLDLETGQVTYLVRPESSSSSS